MTLIIKQMSITLLPCSLGAVFMMHVDKKRPHPPTILICHDLDLIRHDLDFHINERETPRHLKLTNHKGSISRH